MKTGQPPVTPALLRDAPPSCERPAAASHHRPRGGSRLRDIFHRLLSQKQGPKKLVAAYAAADRSHHAGGASRGIGDACCRAPWVWPGKTANLLVAWPHCLSGRSNAGVTDRTPLCGRDLKPTGSGRAKAEPESRGRIRETGSLNGRLLPQPE